MYLFLKNLTYLLKSSEMYTTQFNYVLLLISEHATDAWNFVVHKNTNNKIQ